MGSLSRIRSLELRHDAKEPHNSRPDTRKLQTTFGLTLPPWQQGVERMLEEVLGSGKLPAR